MDLASPDLIFLNETMLFQFEVNQTIDLFHGECCHALNSEDSLDPELPFLRIDPLEAL